MFPRVPVLVISGTDDRALVGAALLAGAAGYIVKSTSRGRIIAALRQVAVGGSRVPPEFTLAPQPG